MSFREIKLRKNPDTPKVEKLIDYEEFCGINVSDDKEDELEITVDDLKNIQMENILPC